MERIKKTYIMIPILGIIGTIFNRFTYYPLNHSTFYGLRRSITTLLGEFDFTGMTSIFFNMITIFNIGILLFDLYLVIKAKKDGFPYYFNKIFTFVFIVLIFITISSFIIIRNKEEKIAQEFEKSVNSITNGTIQIETLNTRLNKLQKLESDKFSSFKIKIANEIKSMSTIERYLRIFLSNLMAIRFPPKDIVYYSIFYRFVLLDFLLCMSFAFHIKDKSLERKSNF